MLFWEKWKDPDVPSIDLLWYFHEAFGDEATFALAQWCIKLIQREDLRIYAERDPSDELAEFIPLPILQVQQAWRVLMTEQINRSEYIDELARKQMKQLAASYSPTPLPDPIEELHQKESTSTSSN